MVPGAPAIALRMGESLKSTYLMFIGEFSERFSLGLGDF